MILNNPLYSPSRIRQFVEIVSVCPVPETFGDYISKFSQICGYISKFGQINFNPVTKYSQILTIFRDMTKFRNIVTKSFGHRKQ